MINKMMFFLLLSTTIVVASEKDVNIVNRVTQVNKDTFHGGHWGCIYDLQQMKQFPANYFEQMAEDSVPYLYNENIVVLKNDIARFVVRDDFAIAYFPYFKGSKIETVKVDSIEEWSPSFNLEAEVNIIHPSGSRIKFFATDYAFNKDTYREQKELPIQLSGLAYSLKNFDLEETRKSVKKNKSNLTSEQYAELKKKLLNQDYFYGALGEVDPGLSAYITFFGFIQNFKKHQLGDIDGFIVTIQLAADFCLDIFIVESRLQTELELNKKVAGAAWIQGTLEGTTNFLLTNTKFTKYDIHSSFGNCFTR